MNKDKITVYSIVAIALLMVFLFVYFQFFSESKNNARKRDQVYKLYLSYKKEFPDVQDVSPREALELVNTGKVVFIDIREVNEQNVSHLPGAINIDSFIENFEIYNDFIKIGYDTIGYRSGLIVQEFHQKGIPIYNLRGGLLAWVHAGGNVYNGDVETRHIHVYRREWDLVPEGYEAVW